MTITVFLADDHAVVRDGLRYLLEAQPDMVVVGDAGDGRETVRLVNQRCPDIVIMDIAMPELNGIEATWEIGKRCPSAQVIILSMHSTDEHIKRAVKTGARGFLLKESAGVEVVKAVREVHKGECYFSQKISSRLIDSIVRQLCNDEGESQLDKLSPREIEVLQLVVEGKKSSEIADILSLSPKTIETYRSRLMNKLGIEDIPGLVKFAIQHGLTTLE
jgi:DNA-binding NarL/FixJ family response regulator